MSQNSEINPWSLYWSEDRLYSCVAHSSDEDQKVLEKLWQKFSQELKPDSRLLDLASGNGAVPAAMLSVNDSLKIDAVDKASIDPKKVLTEHCLSQVDFHADTDLLDLPFESSAFDALTSQFGIEYAGLELASQRVAPLLKPGGRFQFVVHHADSGIILSSKNKIIEFEQITQEAGILDALIAVLGGKQEFAQLELAGREYLEQDLLRSEQISGQVFAGIERIIGSFSSHPKESLELGVAMNLRVRSELARLQQLIKAGQSTEAMNLWVEQISAAGFETELSPIYIDSSSQDYLLGWLAIGTRSQ